MSSCAPWLTGLHNQALRNFCITLHSFNIFSTFFKIPVPLNSCMSPASPVPVNLTAFLPFHPQIDLASFSREDGGSYIPANKLPILPAFIPFIHPLTQSSSLQLRSQSLLCLLPPPPALQPCLILSQSSPFPRMGFLHTTHSPLIAEPRGGFSVFPSRYLCSTKLTHHLILEPLYLSDSGRSWIPGVLLLPWLLLVNPFRWSPISYPGSKQVP